MSLKQLYFKHDFNSRNHPKLTKIKKQFQYEGVGIYWSLIEIFYENNAKIKKELFEDLLWVERIDYDKAMKILKIIGFEEKDDCYYLKSVNERIVEREEYCNSQRIKANKRWNNEKNKKPNLPEWYDKHKEEMEKKLEEQQSKKITYNDEDIENFVDKLNKNK